MKSKDIFWGVLLIGFGVLFLLRNFDIISFNWYHLRELWPLLIILLGIAILPVNGFVRIIVAFALVLVSVFYLTRHTPDNPRFFRWPGSVDRNIRIEEDKTKSSKHEWSDQLLYKSYNAALNHAVLEMDAIAGEFILQESDDHLLKFEKEGNLGDYELKSEEAGSNVILRLTMENSEFRTLNKTNDATISLHTSPIWDIKMDAAAAKIDFDLEPFRVDRIEIDGGATSLHIKLGDRHPETNLRINAGVASVVIEVPEASGCEVFTSTVLTKRSLKGLFREDDNTFRTENFDESAEKVSIRIDAAVSNFRVERY
jgi:hypothetical protein